MAKLRGAEVVATVGSDAKADLARAAGADHVVNYTTTDLVAGVEDAVGPEAIDVVYDGVGAAVYDDSLRLLRLRGSMVTFGNASGAVEPKAPLHLMGKSLWLTRPKLWDFISTRAELDARVSDVFGWIASVTLDIRIAGRGCRVAEAPMPTGCFRAAAWPERSCSCREQPTRSRRRSVNDGPVAHGASALTDDEIRAEAELLDTAERERMQVRQTTVAYPHLPSRRPTGCSGLAWRSGWPGRAGDRPQIGLTSLACSSHEHRQPLTRGS
ncbi:Quinone oxidoreductase 1 [Geodia barretti]|uniref:Quinone oxidoreductase 1 n=1 Tax=Geodia barretti TaxID=519541 RepID=A0AA35T7P5_GEOBA|nr:Quinone oxidoreductase 1 [Geodia barretti]